MKKFFSTFLPPLAGLLIFGLSARLFAAVYLGTPWLHDVYWLVHLILPLVLMGSAIALHWSAKGRTPMYLLSYLLNSIGSGCLLGAIYGLRHYVPTPDLLIGLIPAAFLCAAACLIWLLPSDFWKELLSLVLTVLAVGLIVAGIFVWRLHSMPFGCAFLFSGLFILPFPRAMFNADEDWSRHFHFLSRSGFGAFFFVITVAAFILSDGDILDGVDGIDFSDIGGSGKKKGK